MSQPTSHRSQAQAARKLGLLLWLAFVLLSFQTLGHLHRHLHAPGQSSGASVAVAPDGWGHQNGDLSCQLFDQLSQDHALGGQFAVDAVPATPLLAAATAWVSCSAASHWKRGARGPPLSA
jgi:hypothetical protein